MLYRGRVLNSRQALDLLAERDEEIVSLQGQCGAYTRELIRLRAPQAGMVMAALSGAGLDGEPTVEQFTFACEALNENLRDGRSWFAMCDALRARLGIAQPEPVKKRRRAA